MADKRISAAEIRRVWLDPSLTSIQAARAVGLTRVNLWLRAKSLGLPPRGRGGRPVAIRDRALFARLWHGRVRKSEMAAHFGCSVAAIENMVRRMGLSRRAHGKRAISLCDFLLAEAMAADGARHKRLMAAQAQAEKLYEVAA